ncbi:MAG: ribosomal L7Ae/L30e/S12e/Gadd45 family protein [Clostridia bacterium]|nr:ribosomal L7Ae/L30e/S12e/Gadd45 family protein [Clostridia bacterium]
MRKKIYSYLGFATKSGNLMCGFNTCTAAMRRGRAKLLLVAEDISENTGEKIIREAEKTRTVWRKCLDMKSLSEITGEDNAGIFAVTDDNFAKVILTEIDGEQAPEQEV